MENSVLSNFLFFKTRNLFLNFIHLCFTKRKLQYYWELLNFPALRIFEMFLSPLQTFGLKNMQFSFQLQAPHKHNSQSKRQVSNPNWVSHVTNHLTPIIIDHIGIWLTLARPITCLFHHFSNWTWRRRVPPSLTVRIKRHASLEL